MTDLAAIKSGDQTVEILHPGTGEKLGVRVTILSLNDERLLKVRRAITDKRLNLEARGKSFKATDLEENLNNLILAAVVDWEWYNPTGKDGEPGFDPNATPSFEGEMPEFNRKNILAVIKALPWFADQLNEAFNETKSFFDGSKLS